MGNIITLPAQYNEQVDNIYQKLRAAHLAAIDAVTAVRDFVRGDDFNIRDKRCRIGDFFKENTDFLNNYITTTCGRRTVEMVSPLVGRYWVARENEASNPFALIHPYELTNNGVAVMSSLVCYLGEPNYRCALSTEHIHILSRSEGAWSTTLHLTEITKEEFRKAIEDGIDNIFTYREYRELKSNQQ